MEKRVIIAIVLSMFIILMFQSMLPKPKTPRPEAASQPLPTETVKTEEPSFTIPKEMAVQEKELRIETDKYILIFSNIGGSLKTVYLKEFKTPGTDEPLKLTHIDNPKEYIFGISSQTIPINLDTSIYNVAQEGDAVIYSIRADNFEIIKRFNLHKSNYTIELQLFIKNTSASQKEFKYRIIGGSGIIELNAQDKKLIEVTAKVNEKVFGFRRPKPGERITNPGVVSWEAMKNKYFSIILKPLVNTTSQFYTEDKNGILSMGVEPVPQSIQVGSLIENKFLLFVGPSQISVLKKAGYNLDETVNYGFFGGISKLLIATMRFFYMIVHSWGIAIILLSVFLNVILFPLTAKSFKSIQKMQEIHPQMEKLKAQLKDNPQKLNKEILELYKKYHINPFGGCLPMLLQMPIFIALYQALMKSIELRCAGFLWIKDLSQPDAVPIPISLPIFGNSINILPIIMIVAMVVQQKVSTKSMGAAVTDEQKQQQKIMLIMMPIMFGFIFYNMPSGLVLYWVVNTILTLVEQAVVIKQA